MCEAPFQKIHKITKWGKQRQSCLFLYSQQTDYKISTFKTINLLWDLPWIFIYPPTPFTASTGKERLSLQICTLQNTH